MGLAGSAGVEFYANTVRFQEGVKQAVKATNDFQGKLGELHRSSGRLQNALFNLGGAAIGIKGPLGKVVETLSTFAIGGWAAAVAGGIALIAAGFRKMQEDADNAFSASKRLVDELAKRRTGGETTIGAQKDLARYQQILDQVNSGNFPMLSGAEARDAGVGFFASFFRNRQENIQVIKTWAEKRIKDTAEALADSAFRMPEYVVQAAQAKGAGRGQNTIEAAIQRIYNNGLIGPGGIPGVAGGPGGDMGLPEILRGGRAANGPNQQGMSPMAQQALERSKQVAAQWKEAWLQAIRNIQDSMADLFVSILTESRSVLDVLRNLMQALLQIAANMLASKIIGAVAGSITGGGGSLEGASGNGLGLARSTVVVNNVMNVSAIDARGVDAMLMRHAGTITAATIMGVRRSQQAAVALGVR